MSVPTIPVPEPAAQQEPVAEPAKVERPPLHELLPTGSSRVVVAAAGIALAVGSFAHFGFTGHALLGAVFCPALVLLAAIDLQHKLLPNMIVLPTSLAVGLIVAASAPGDFLAHFLAGARARRLLLRLRGVLPGQPRHG